MIKRSLAAMVVLAAVSAAVSAWGQTPILSGKLEGGDRVALCGDSITEQKNYTCLVQGYLLSARPVEKLEIANFGWGGETSWGFKGRMANDVLWFKPTVATVCYGMNDGGYRPLEAERAKNYAESTRDIVRQFKAAGVRLIVLCGPGCVDTDVFQWGGPKAAVEYNKTLSALNDEARYIAKEEGVGFADMFNTMHGAMERFKEKFPGKSFIGSDGIHPENNGHVVMAYTVLKALAVDGNVGTLTVDLGANTATGSEGQTIDSFKEGTLTVTSARWPLPIGKDWTGGPASLGVGMELVPFEEELNRYVLVAKGGTAASYDVTWGDKGGQTVRMSAEELAKGVNLMERFTKFPFDQAFHRLDGAVHAQQDFEIPTMKQFIHLSEENQQEAKESPGDRQSVVESSQKLAEALRQRTMRAVRPVTHSLVIKAVQ